MTDKPKKPRAKRVSKEKPAKVKKPRGRSTLFGAEVADAICERIANGESLRSICDDDDMPNKATVFRWLAKHQEFGDQYARAREIQADALFDDILSIADDARNDWMERRGEDDAGWVANGEHIQRSRLRIEARKWMAGKLRPKKYGERIEVEGNLRHEHITEISDNELARIAAAGRAGTAAKAPSSNVLN